MDLAVYQYDSWEGQAPDVSGDSRRHLWNNVVVTELYPTIVPWVAPKDLELTRSGIGAVRCPACGLLARHELTWPSDAYWRWDIRGATLWAWSRGHAAAIRDYVGQTHRDASAFDEWYSALVHLPKEFLDAKVRDLVVRRIDRDLRRT